MFSPCRYIDGVQTSFIFIKHWDLAVRSDENPPSRPLPGPLRDPGLARKRLKKTDYESLDMDFRIYLLNPGLNQ